ncbi:ATP-grasp domain-containing protein [Streptococcus zalophi]|uniref:ATP-grasp domain-containing protein n=1 Tax=Streptococcus zalophi TaxID=640031 RepID=A0A934P985_9STRE|nr:ATP-grasp domain-containing protein [Streptococcus zalophi]MBJ8349332.1 ATP-grasp domain-containing protein [Streptococcus zalophi]
MSKTIMILGGSILQLPAILKAKQLGLKVVVVDMDENAVGFKQEGIYREYISTIDKEKVLAAAIKHQIDGIMTLASDLPIRTVSYVCQKLNLIGPSENTAINATDKNKMREVLFDNQVPIPQFKKVNSFSEFIDAVSYISDLGHKVILKPSDNSGSRGIQYLDIDNKDKLVESFQYSKEFSRSGILLVEEFMEGPEVSVETFAIDGQIFVIQITDKITTGYPNFVEIGHSQPTCLNQNVVEQIKEVAIKANKALGIENGPSHTEIIVTKQGPKIVEIGARLGGDNISTHLVPMSTGIDLVENCIKMSLGESVFIEQKWSKGAAIKYFVGYHGKLQKISNIEEALKIDGVEDIVFVKEIGSVLKDIQNSTDRLGYVLSSGKTATLALDVANKAIKTVNVYCEEE